MSDEETGQPAQSEPASLKITAPAPRLDEDDDEVLEAGPETALMW
jgi:hypothetical protein